MMTAKLIAVGESQAVLLPEGCWFDGDEVYINRFGGAVVLAPKRGDTLAPMLTSADLFTDDFLKYGRRLHGTPAPSTPT